MFIDAAPRPHRPCAGSRDEVERIVASHRDSAVPRALGGSSNSAPRASRS